jgi:hypothetical protein
MRIRRIAVLIDGGFFLKRLPTLVGACNCTTPQQVANIAHHLCKRHVQRITHCASDGGVIWLDHAYRLFYYDAAPYEGVSHHPVLNREIEFGKSDVAAFRRELFSELRQKRKLALRLGSVTRIGNWRLSPRLTSQILKIGKWIQQFEAASQKRRADIADQPPTASGTAADTVRATAEPFQQLARRFKVSPIVAARRASDLQLITRNAFFEFHEAYEEDDRRVRTKQSDGDDFCATQNTRIAGNDGNLRPKSKIYAQPGGGVATRTNCATACCTIAVGS